LSYLGLPQGIDSAYERILNRSPKQHVARTILHIILGAKRPFSLADMSVALVTGVSSDKTSAMDEIIRENELEVYLRHLCGLFVAVVDDKVYLLHQTAREFLVCRSTEIATTILDVNGPSKDSQRNGWKHSMTIEDSNSVLAEICITYLHLGFASEKPVLLENSARNWPDHYHQSAQSCQERVATTTLDICSQPKLYTQWTAICAKVWSIPVNGPSICLVAALGLDKVMEMLLREYNFSSRIVKTKVDIESENRESGQTPLSWAAMNGHEAVVRLLLEAGADIESEDSLNGKTPLSTAAGMENEAIVRLLLGAGANIEYRRKNGETPLLLATLHGTEAIVRVLLEAGADVECRGRHGHTPLSRAAARGHEAVVRLLLEAGADIKSRDNEGQTPLSWADTKEVTARLLEAGADVESKDDKGRTALLWAVLREDEAAIRLLVEAGADIESRDNRGRTPLSRARIWGLHAIVTELERSSSSQPT
jgi:ankyrin repeat protein